MQGSMVFSEGLKYNNFFQDFYYVLRTLPISIATSALTFSTVKLELVRLVTVALSLATSFLILSSSYLTAF